MLHYTTFKNAKIRYSDEGKGRVIVFVHGFPEGLEMWKDFSAELSKFYRVIAIDLPGFGESECIRYTHSMELFAECIHEVMRQLNLRRYIIIGHSMGGYAALAFGELFPDNLRGMVLFHSSSYKDTDEKKEDRDRTIVTIKKRPKTFLKIFTGNLFAAPNPPKGALKKEHDKNLKLIREIASACTPRALVAAMEGMKIRKDREIILRFAQYPVLFIYGRKDKIFKLETVLPQTETAPDHEVLILENAAHMGMFEAKEETLNAIARFAKRCFGMRVR